jgi:hypothetical protein
MDYEIERQMREEFTLEIENGNTTLEYIRDNSGEWIDGYLPVYYNRIVEEWQKMPASYNDRGRAELGVGDEFTIYSLMSLDLFVYYSDIFEQVITELEQEAGE